MYCKILDEYRKKKKKMCHVPNIPQMFTESVVYLLFMYARLHFNQSNAFDSLN